MEGLNGAIDKPVQFANYFYTDAGKTLAYSIAELTDFSLKTAILSFPFDNLMPMLKKDLHSKQVNEQVLKSLNPTMSERYRNLLADFLLQYDDLLNKGDINPPFPSRDMGRFLALHVLSLYSYIDVYTDEILDRLTQEEKLLKRMIKKLESEHGAIIKLKDLHRYADDQENVLIKTVRRNLPRNLGAKIDFIVAIGGFENELMKVNEIVGYSTYRGLLSKLINLRNIFAHGEPCPEISALKDGFKDAPVEGIWRGFLKSLNTYSEGPLVEAGIYDLMMEFLVEQGPMFSIILTTMIIALIPPLIIDAAISKILTKH